MLTLNSAYISSPAIDAIPLSVRTPSYTPVDHSVLMHYVMGAFTRLGYDIETPVHHIHKKKPRFASTFSVSGGELPNDLALDWQAGVLNSYDKSYPVTLLFGGRVFVCANGLVIAENRLATRHTTNVWDRIPALIIQSVCSFQETIAQAHARHNRLRETFVDDRRMIDAFAVEVCRQGLLPASKAVEYANEIHKPSFDYGIRENSLWNIHNAFTHTAKGMEAANFSRSVVKFDKLLDSSFAIL